MRPQLVYLAIAAAIAAGCSERAAQRDIQAPPPLWATPSSYRDQSTKLRAAQRATDAADVIPLLADGSPFVRRAAAETLGRLKDTSAVPSLATLLAHERPLGGFGMRTPKAVAIEALGQIGGLEAKAAVLDVLRTRLAEGPAVKDHIARDTDYYGVIYYGVTALKAWSDQPDVEALTSSLAGDMKWFGRIDALIQERAWAILLDNKATRAHHASAHDRATFLLSQLTGSGNGHLSDWARPGYKTAEAARNSALMRMLSEMGTAIVPELHDEQRRGPDPSKREALTRLATQIQAQKTMGEPVFNAPDK